MAIDTREPRWALRYCIQCGKPQMVRTDQTRILPPETTRCLDCAFPQIQSEGEDLRK